MTLTFAVVISGFIALTLTPALCAILMKKGHHESRVCSGRSTSASPGSRGASSTRSSCSLRQPVLSLLAFVGVLGLSVVPVPAACPSSFVPTEDQGYIFGNVQLPDGATLERTRAIAAELGKIVQAEPGVQNTMVINGFDLLGGGNKTNAATMFIPLKHWDQRKDAPRGRGGARHRAQRARACATAW